jgi:hypothetical protein
MLAAATQKKLVRASSDLFLAHPHAAAGVSRRAFLR